MFSKIMIPLDLRHLEDMQKALAVAANLAKTNDATLVYVSVTTEQPSSIAHTPAEFQEKLEAFAEEQAQKHGISAQAHSIASADPATDLDSTLMNAEQELGADLVVMQSHVPRLTDYIWPSNGGRIAAHSKVSVMIVRGE